jgi:flagellar basal body rod protein FlgG
VGGKNSASATFAYKTTSSSSYSAETAIAQSTDKIFGGSFSSLTAYHVRFTITDALGSVTTYVATVDSLKIALEFESNANRLWVHCPLTVNADATFNNLVTSGGNSHLMLNGQSYISLRTSGTERGYFHSGGLHVAGTVSCTNLSVTNPPWPTSFTWPNTINASQDSNAFTINGYAVLDISGGNVCVNRGLYSYGYPTNIYGSPYVRFMIGGTERGYFHSSGLNVSGTVSCTNLSVTNPPWPTSFSLPSSPSFSGTVYGNRFHAYADGQAYTINGYEILDIASSNIRVNYGLRSNYSTNVYGATYVRFFIGNTERAYVSSSGINNSSRAEQKEGIAAAGSALAIVENARLYKYRYTVPEVEAVPEKEGIATANAQAMIESSEATEPHRRCPERMGFVIGDGYDPPPECVLAEDGNGVNLYAMASVCWRGLQELLARVNALERK